jgi:predicted O-linked N-acetylglucosamine transferase (SPINDLY family)
MDAGAKACANLRAAAEARGIAAERLIFAPRMEAARHLARQAHADLFLDTFSCNAHTTASDALWAGVPLLTLTGRSFAARVATSLVRAAGLDEMAVETAERYEQLALALAQDPPRLQALKARAMAARGSAPLFDIGAYVGALEEGYRRAFQRWRDGKAPAAIDLA